jgi:DMSO/TMAO reductase YedYZ molybdopterin-dependent catalytic subunit
MNDRTIGRAGFLGILGAGALGLFYARDVGGLIGRVVPQSVSSIVPTSGWRIYTIGNSMPTYDPASYRLTVGGLVDRPASLTIADLQGLPHATQISSFHCVTGWVVNGVHWGGVRIQDLLDHVGAQKGAHALRFVSEEKDYDDSLTLDQALLPDVMLAYEMDGGALSRPHGAPLRLVMPQMYGYKSVKWVKHIEVQAAPQPGYWEQHGYDVDAWIGKSNGYY